MRQDHSMKQGIDIKVIRPLLPIASSKQSMIDKALNTNSTGLVFPKKPTDLLPLWRYDNESKKLSALQLYENIRGPVFSF